MKAAFLLLLGLVVIIVVSVTPAQSSGANGYLPLVTKPQVTATPTPTATPTSTPSAAPCDCDGPDLDCDHFDTQDQAQACYEHCLPSHGDVFDLDRDHDGVACEALP